MRGSWNRTVKVSGSTSELMDVVQWLAESALHWPEETLRWLTGDAPEPSWITVQDLDLAAFRVELEATRPAPQSLLPSAGSVAEEVRAWRRELRQSATEHDDDPSWTHSALLGTDSVAFQVDSPEGMGRWSGFTLANFADADAPGGHSDGGGGDGGGGDGGDVWVRFEPQEPSPTRHWLIVSSLGWVVRLRQNDTGQLHLTVEHTDPADPEAALEGRGEVLVEVTADRIDAVASDVVLTDGRGRVRRLDASLTPSGTRGRKVRVAAAGVASVRPRWWNMLTLFWPIVRLVYSRRMGRELANGIDLLLLDPKWPDVGAVARIDRERRSAK